MVLKQRFAVLTLLLTAGSAAPALADTWTVDAGRSRLGFEVKQGDSTLKGVFGTWTADIEFDPEAPGTATISATVNPASASTGNPQFDGTLTGADWFDVNAFPDAVFKADGATLVEGSSYRTEGMLSIKGLSHPVDLDFTLEIDGDTASAKGTATLSRLDYKLGSSVGTDTVGEVVTVTLDLTATR